MNVLHFLYMWLNGKHLNTEAQKQILESILKINVAQLMGK